MKIVQILILLFSVFNSFGTISANAQLAEMTPITNKEYTKIFWADENDHNADILSITFVADFKGIILTEYVNPNGGYSWRPSETVNKNIPITKTYVGIGCTGSVRNGIKFKISNYEGTYVTSTTSPEVSGNIAVLKIVTCDGRTVMFEDPFNPPPPDPPVDPPTDGGDDTGGGEPPTNPPLNACGNPRWENMIKNWTDDIFCPVIAFLDIAKEKLAGAATMTGQGLNIGKYLSVFGDLPGPWQAVVSSLLLMVATLGGILIFRSAMRIYYSVKEGVKWW